METNNMDDLLSNLDDSYQSAEASEGGLELPGGEYIFWVKEAEVCKAKSSDRIHVKMQCVVVDDSKYRNMPHYSYDLRFTDSDGQPDMRAMGFFKLACQKMGLLPPSTIKDAPEVVAQMVNRIFAGAIVISKCGKYRNLRINRLISDNYTHWVEQGCPIGPETSTKSSKDW